MEKEIKINGLKLRYSDTGNPEGLPAVLMHGWGCNHSTVKSIASCLEDGMRIISVDLPGHGESDEPVEIWGSHDFATFILEFISQLNLTDVSLIGHSFGGRTAIAMACQAPKGLINKMVLVDSAGITPKRTLKYYYKVYSYKAIKKIALSILGKEKGSQLIEKTLREKGSADYKAASPKMRAIMSKCVNEDLRKILPGIKVPVLLVWGTEDTATPMSDAKLMERLIPDSGLVELKNCGHYSFLDSPVIFKSVMREFFKNELSKNNHKQ